MFFRRKKSSLLDALSSYESFERHMLEQSIRDLKEENKQLHRALDETAKKISELKQDFNADDLYIDHLKDENASLKEENEALLCEIASLKRQVTQIQNPPQHVCTKPTSSTQKEETYYYMEAANGMTVRVPESKMDSWLKAQEDLRQNQHSKAADEEK